MDPKRKILIVDDEPDSVDILKIGFEIEGYEVLTALDGLEGLEKARKEHPHVVIMDIRLPQLSGYQVCRFLKETALFSKISVILLADREEDMDKKTAREAGADLYFVKADNKKLFQAVSEFTV